MRTYAVLMDIRAENESDCRELIEDFTGKETNVVIREVIGFYEKD